MIKQKLIIDGSKTTQFQIIVRDETGTYTNSNTTGYGNPNLPETNINRYIFEINNLNTNITYKQVQSNNRLSSTDIIVPTVEEIYNKEDVYLEANYQNISSFDIGVYKINMYTEFLPVIEGEGFINTETIVNVQGAQAIYNNYQAVIIDDEVYDIINYSGSSLILNKPLHRDIVNFKSALKTSNTFVLYDNMEDCINSKIANFFDNCDCDSRNELNLLSELNLLDWGIKNSIIKEDYSQAKMYLDLLYNICKISNCGC